MSGILLQREHRPQMNVRFYVFDHPQNLRQESLSQGVTGGDYNFAQSTGPILLHILDSQMALNGKAINDSSTALTMSGIVVFSI